MPSLTLNLLGTPAAQFDGKPFVLSAKPLVLLSLLAFQSLPGTPTTRDELAAWLWSDTSNPLANLSVTLNLFRKVLGAQSIASDERTRTLALNLEYTCDALECLAVTHEPNPERWDEIWNAWNGVFLGFPDASWDLQLAPPFQDWLSEVRGALHEARRHLASRMAGLALEAGRYADAVTYLEHASPEASDPRETQAIQMMLALTALDRPEDAVLVHKALSDALHELDTKPSTDALAAFEMARDQQVAAARAVLAQLFPSRSEGLNVPFVGRESDLEQLERLLPRSLEGIGWLTMITGEPGSGKTALARAAMQRLDARERIYLHCEGFGERNAPAWRGFDLICRNLVRRRRTVFDAMPTELRAVLARFLPDVLEPVTQDPQPGDERLLYAAIRTLLIHDDQPTLLFLDDLQWFDETSLGLVLELLRKPPPRGLLVIATFRDTEPPLTTNTQGIWARLLEVIHRDKRGQELALSALDLNAVEQLSRELQQPANTDWMHAQSGGNPLYLLEMFEANYTQPGRVPPDLEALIRTRIDTLPQRSIAREVLEACAVLGESTSLNEVKNVSGFDYDTTVQALGSLRDARLLQRAEARIQMNHNLTRDATLERMSLERGQVLNLRAARVRQERPELAAMHYWAVVKSGTSWLEPNELQKISETFVTAGSSQALLGDLDGGLIWFERILNYTQDINIRIHVFVRRAKVFERLSRYDDALRDLESAELLASNAEIMIRVQVMNSRAMIFAHCYRDPDNTTQIATQIIDILSELEGPEVLLAKADAWNSLGIAAWLLNELDKAEFYHKEALAIWQIFGRLDKIAGSLHNLALVLIQKNDLNAKNLLDEVIIIRKKLGDLPSLAETYADLGYHFWHVGDLTNAEKYLEESLLTIQPIGEEVIGVNVYNSLGAVRFLQNRFIESREIYRKTLLFKSISKSQSNKVLVLANIIEAELRIGCLDEALANVEQAFNLIGNFSIPSQEARLYWYKGEIYSLREDYNLAKKFFQLAKIAAHTSKRKKFEAKALARLAYLQSDVELAIQAIQLSDGPFENAALMITKGLYLEAYKISLNIEDSFEKARMLQDISFFSGDMKLRIESSNILRSIKG
jgi:tetratricopeptide (TPR) repeat protein/DNA-binding SARP family transcriptional activator